MAKKDFGKTLKDKIQSTVDSAKEAAKDIDLSEIKSKISDTVDSAKDAVKDINVEDVKSKISETVDQAKDTIEDAFKKKDNSEEVETTEPEFASIISTKSAMKIIYYLMAADGEIFHSEEAKFNDICKELSPDYKELKEQIVQECSNQLGKVIDSSDYYDALQEGVEDALINSRKSEDSFITPKLLIWDLLTLAYSDENYNETERKLIKYIVRKTNIDKAVFLEMESSILTLMDIEKELEWIKTTDRPYLQIETMVNELNERKSVIFESVKDLIAL